jgi:arabinosyltransferase C
MPHSAAERQLHIRKHAFVLGCVAAGVALLPALIALAIAPPGGAYLGYVTSTDDHMVYSAWMRQSMDGAFLFDNRFTLDPQPGLTVHLYFWLLGQAARVIGIPEAATIARIGFSLLFVVLCGRLLVRSTLDVFTSKLALTLIVIGGGVGYLFWQQFGQAVPPGGLAPPFLMGRLPVDVWQPEGFVLASMLTNGLFMVSLCLIVAVWIAALESRHSWRHVPVGALAFGALMNIHSYDVLLMVLVFLAWVAASVAAGQFSWIWFARVAVIGLGALPAALWFLYVLSVDPVFQARAATETFSPNFRQVVAGYLPLLVLAVLGIAMGVESRLRAQIAALSGAAGVLGLAVAAGTHEAGFWMGPAAWVMAYVAAGALTVAAWRHCPVWNLAVAWSWVGLVAPYFPALFQRKLLMGLAIPLAILAAVGIAEAMRRREKGRDRGPRNLTVILALAIVGGSSVRWFTREVQLIQANVSSTAVQPAFLSRGVRDMLEIIDRTPGRKAVLAMPGVPQTLPGQPHAFVTPYLPDLNPIVTGLTGAYTYAGHWSETPFYETRRERLTSFFLARTAPEVRARMLETKGARFVIAPRPEVFRQLPLADLTGLGQVRYAGTQFLLIEVRR